jgi:hypothetical protein
VPRGREGRGRSTRRKERGGRQGGGSEVGGGSYAAPILLSKLVIFLFLQYYTNVFYRPWLNMYLRNQVMMEIKRSLHFFTILCLFPNCKYGGRTIVAFSIWAFFMAFPSNLTHSGPTT